MDEMTVTTTAKKTDKAKTALVKAEERQAKIAQKKAEYRIKWQRMYADYREQREVERLQKACEILATRGRPETITDETITRILDLHASGESLTQCCELFGHSRISLWRRVQNDDGLRNRLADAREANAHARIDRAWTDARVEPDVERAKLLADMARWEASKVLPALYGERVQLQAPDGVVFSLNIGQLPEPKEEKEINPAVLRVADSHQP